MGLYLAPNTLAFGTFVNTSIDAVPIFLKTQTVVESDQPFRGFGHSTNASTTRSGLEADLSCFAVCCDSIVGQKRSLKPKHVWAIRVRLELAENHRDLALFNLAIDSKLRGCDLVRMKVVDVMASGQIKERASVLQSKTQKPVRFEISEGTRASVEKWMKDPLMIGSEYLWPGRFHERLHISTRQYARIARGWVSSIGLEVTAYGTHSMRRTKVTQIYKKTGNLRAVQLLLVHTKMDSTVRYLGVELEDALAICEALEI